MKIKEIQYISPDLFAPKDAWDKLSMAEKSEMMKVAVRNGITDLKTIKEKYNEFADGGRKDVEDIKGNIYTDTWAGNQFKKGGRKKSLQSIDNPATQQAMQYFINKGLAQHQAAGLVGNLFRESRLIPTATNASSGAYGIAQWLGNRKKNLFAKYGKNPTLNQQLDYVWHELNNTHTNGLKKLKASRDSAEAARNAMGFYEFMAGPDAAIREMRKYGQNGERSMQEGINFASQLSGQPVVPYRAETPQLDNIPFTPVNPEAFFSIPVSTDQPVVDMGPTKTPVLEYDPKEAERQEKRDNLRRFNMFLSMLDGSNESIFPFSMFAEGGKIHISPSKKGTFTAAASRHNMGVQEFASKVLANKDDYSPAMVKKANFARNSRRWKHGLGGNLFDDEDNLYPDGGVFSKIGQWIRDKKNYIEKRAEEAGVVYKRRIPGQLDNEKYILVPRRPNTSKTKIKSQDLENRMYNMIAGNKERTHYRTNPYDIPYGERTITVQPAGSTIPVTLSVNALDSIAKYAGIVERDPKNEPYIQDTNIFLKEAFGLPYQETRFGAIPYYNYGDLPKGYTNNNLGNANYFRNFGSIPAEHLIRDFRYNGDLVNKKTLERPAPIPLTTPPLKHGLEFYLEGMYNPGDKNHTNDVRRAGSSLWNETTGNFLNWWNTEGKYWKENPEGPKR